MKFLTSILFFIALLTPVYAKEYPPIPPDSKLVHSILVQEAKELNLKVPPLPVIHVIDYCDLQDMFFKIKNACLTQAIMGALFFTTYVKAAYRTNNLYLTTNYDWTELNREKLFILAHELAHHLIRYNGFYFTKETEEKVANQLANAFLKEYTN